MIVIKRIDVENYRVIDKATLKDLKDLNIIIGPNNCGKTSLLLAISKLSEMRQGGGQNYLCSDCEKVAREHDEVVGFSLPINERERFAGIKKSKIAFQLNGEEVDKLFPTTIMNQKSVVDNPTYRVCDVAKANMDKLIFVDSGSDLVGEHVSLFTHRDVLNWLKNTVLMIPEQRLVQYKAVDIRQYITEKNLPGEWLLNWRNQIKQLVDPKLIDYTHSLNLLRDFNGTDFESTFEEEGSGIRSVVCPIVDIIEREDAKIVTFDEPELGLNPASKHKLLEFLLQLSGKRQIFIATHDPTFVNPFFWTGHKVSVYLYSYFKQRFVKVNLEESKQDPATFAGYLPQTVSLKHIHVYVEGSSDVYIFQVFLRKYLTKLRKDWASIMNEIGIYHLGGDFWPHIFSTIPSCPPYKVLVILDGDKRETVEKELKTNQELSRIGFRFCATLGEVKNNFGTLKPVYCLKKTEIDQYLSTRSKVFDKKVDGPAIAEKMVKVPDEIKEIFEILTSQGVDIEKYTFSSDQGKGEDK